ncbi:tRNA 2-selenouridine(34) synthase MnmH [Maritimibacter sp. DP1N21-5]|uniref:tRNA 2-selenouridine(34) synthase MnmH n=1 Tax=Maritimibacter sp. DP1N21-5 TaxID=2836867 RepID=UPI001C495729|nr:tRNA 2-selenouridine(34) synthase MnmH [Maritimibacter sp. DP1N21-5]MBV7410637.1 tRNA 2-selenouridine(34) synthase MnmH [Maritimibacter sp. DP1N21-5]
MPIALGTLTDLAALPFDEIIDVRSPAEFAEDHIPGAINLPVLSNEERAVVGTIYVQEDPFKARKVGAALVARNAARHLEETLADRPGGWRPLVYCWRGGQRSGSFAALLQNIGWRADTVQGGYKTFRRLVVSMLHDQPLPFRPILIDGGTGTAKTRLLHHIAASGGQVIDLEAMAEHRGSLFGLLGGAQPAQKTFESRIAMALTALDPARPVFVEAESSKIGGLLIPPSLWKAMLGAEYYEVQAPLAARAAHLIEAYPDIADDPDRLAATLGKLARYHGHAKVEEWLGLAEARNGMALASDLIATHYDGAYKRIRGDADPREVLYLPDLSEGTLAALGQRLARNV